ncbi:MAG TPA: hypothetical protein VLW44_19705 [Streptosporangiaceae bacterium]|nr:hypothetical protein [Streptosporangiaceae bacterium]
MFLCVLLGGLTVGLTVGLLDVLVFHVDAISSQKTVSAGVDLALGLLLLAVGALVATSRLHGRRKAPVPAGDGPPEKPGGSRPEWSHARMDSGLAEQSPADLGRYPGSRIGI